MILPYYTVGVGELDSLSDQNIAHKIKQSMKDFECLDLRTITRFITSDQVYLTEKHAESHTHLILNKNDRSLIGFFTLGLTSVDWEKVECSDGWSGLSGKKRDRYSKGMYLQEDPHIGVYTIGELARSKQIEPKDFPGSIILKEALGQLFEACELAGGRFILVDSMRKLYDHLYSRAGFIEIDSKPAPDPDDTEEYVVSILPTEELRKAMRPANADVH
jgi:hypothetical protein